MSSNQYDNIADFLNSSSKDKKGIDLSFEMAQRRKLMELFVPKDEGK